MLKQRLSQKMVQKLSPQQIQLMKLLQIPTATLDQRIKEELEANPALDEGEESEEVFDLEDDASAEDKIAKEEEPQKDEEFELDDYLLEYIEEDPSSYKFKTSDYTLEEEDKKMPIAVEDTFYDYLEEQLGLLDFSNERELIIAKQIVGSIDNDGYLRREPLSIIDDLMFTQNVNASEEEILYFLEQIQDFDPPGIASRSLQECLAIQIKRKIKNEVYDDPILLEKSLLILNEYFDEFSKKHYNKLLKGLNISEDELKEIIEEILKLNPKPASGYKGGNTSSRHYIVPDFILTNKDGELDLILNSKNAPDLRINDHYVEMLKNYNIKKKDKKNNSEDKKAILFIKQKIDSAKWFIDAIKQRQQTLFNTMYTIMQFQYEFFLSGDQKRLKPMILKDIAEITLLDISTISRVVNSKYVQTEFGTKSLKEFFSESLQTKDGEEVSTLEVKKILSDIIDAETKKKPLSDEKLKEMLRDKGYNIARRTVAKYREQLNIPVARLRKEL